MKKRVISACLAMVMAIMLLPVLPASAAASITPDEIKARANKYISALEILKTDENYQICNVFWNKAIRSNDDALCADLDNFRSSGNVSYLYNHIKKGASNKCIGGEHSYPGTCTSNGFQLSYQCMGFARYFMYYLFGAKPKNNSTDYYTYTISNASWDSIGGPQIGDYIHFTTGNQKYHPVVYYGDEGGTMIAIHANGLKDSYPCGIQYGKVYKNNSAFYSISDIKAMYNAGTVHIIRYKNIVTCSHKTNGKSAYVYQSSEGKAVCSLCTTAYTVPTTLSGGPAYMDIVDVNSSSKTAPAHDQPYGDAKIGTRYEKGETVYVRGSVTNAFGNTWYQLMTGEWLTGDYLGEHIHCWSSGGFCTHCLEGYWPIWMGPVSLKVANKKAPIHFAPYGDSLIFDSIKANTTLTVDAKVVNGYGNEWYRIAGGTYKGGWIFQDYFDTQPSKYKANGAIDLKYGPGSVYNAVAHIPANKEFLIYTKEKSTEGPDWYSARYGDIVGFVPKSSVTAVNGGRYVEAPSVPEPSGKTVDGTVVSGGGSSYGGSSSGGGSSSSGVSSVFVQYPTDPTYLSKFAVSDTSATVVANILKPAGTRVTACGLLLYNSNGELIKDHREAISNVGTSVTSFHAWYDIGQELGLTLTPGTKYLYAIYAVVDGVVYEEGRLSFTTTGTAPAAAPTQVYVFYPSDQNYLNKFAVSETNATVVANVLKPAGTKVTACGLRLYDVNGNLIKDHRETVSNVGDAMTSFHVWYDIQNEVGLTLTPGTYYRYQIYAVVDGVVYEEGMYSFTTTGTAPVTPPPTEEPKKYILTFDPNGGTCDPQSKTITFDTAIGDLPTPIRDGYTFMGWHLQGGEGARIGEQTRYTTAGDLTVSARWSPKTYNLIFNANGGSCTTKNKAISFDTIIGEMPTPVRSGYTFDGWYGATEGGNLIHGNMRYNASFDVTVYAHWSKAKSGADAMKDVASGTWYFTAVDYVISNGLMSGYNATTFGPDDSLNRAMMLQILYNKEGQPAVSGKHSFTDAPASQWYNNAITWGTRKGIMGGYGGGKFGPDDAVTIEQIAVILWNYAGKPAVSGNASSVGPHSDWAANALGWAVESGILDGVPYETVTGAATRAKTARMLMNYLEK